MFRQQSVPRHREELKRREQEFWRFADAGFVGDAGLDLADARTSVRREGTERLTSSLGKIRKFQVRPRTFRHQAITWLNQSFRMSDAELQLITGHAKRETLAIYQ
jgi:hypothetical protein